MLFPYTQFIIIYSLSVELTQIISKQRLHGLTDNVAGHRSVVHGFKPRPGYVRRGFHLSLRLINFGGCSAQLAYFVHKSGRKTETIFF